MMARLALIGGTGVYDPDMLGGVKEETVSTPYGVVDIFLGTFQGVEVIFMPGHGRGHTIPPHKINYRGNIWALKELGVTKVVATAAVGSMNDAMRPGHFVAVSQFIDFTKNRPFTFFDGEDGVVVHTDFTEPYCSSIRKVIQEAAAQLHIKLHPEGCYVCVEGPRFETPAEIAAYRRLGGDIVGMTNVPEVVLAREAGLCYAVVATVTNLAAGISPTPLSHVEVDEVMKQTSENLRRLLMAVLSKLDPEGSCSCGARARE
ncbi:MAG: S-methyl-5'-thioadenosine phosphorylase [Firmicutes bacterium]|nr:S-methyl-5'-thioadenosine phosphorylase [Bacillota bacterium]